MCLVKVILNYNYPDGPISNTFKLLKVSFRSVTGVRGRYDVCILVSMNINFFS